jgi:hypothetical protein
MIAFYHKLTGAVVASNGDTQPPRLIGGTPSAYTEIHPPQRWHSHPNQRSRADLLAAGRSGSLLMVGATAVPVCGKRQPSRLAGGCIAAAANELKFFPASGVPRAPAARGGHRPTPPGGLRTISATTRCLDLPGIARGLVVAGSDVRSSSRHLFSPALGTRISLRRQPGSNTAQDCTKRLKASSVWACRHAQHDEVSRWKSTGRREPEKFGDATP